MKEWEEYFKTLLGRVEGKVVRGERGKEKYRRTGSSAGRK